MDYSEIYEIWYENNRTIEDHIGWSKAAKLGKSLSFYRGKQCSEKNEVKQQARGILCELDLIA